MSETVAIKNVEIFAAGTWKGDEYTDADLQSMVDTFTALKGKLDPPVKLGHSEDQDLLTREGWPAAGYVESLRKVGDKLVADFRDVPKRIAELVKRKAYSKISSEILWNWKETASGKIFKRVLWAVALLGEEVPAVRTIGDIEALYAQRAYSEPLALIIEEPLSYEEGDHAVTIDELMDDMDALTNKAELAGMKGKIGAPAVRTYLREVRAKLRQMLGHVAHAEGSADVEAKSQQEVKNMEALAKLLGLAEDADMPAVTKALKALLSANADLEKKLEAATAKAHSEGEASSAAKMAEQAQQLEALRLNLAERDAAAAVDVAMRAGKVTPAQAEWAKGYALKDAEGFKAFVAGAPKVVEFDEKGSAAGTAEVTDDAVAEMSKRVVKFQADHAGTGYADALIAVSSADRALTKRYQEAMR